jgi:hypothetical protein
MAVDTVNSEPVSCRIPGIREEYREFLSFRNAWRLLFPLVTACSALSGAPGSIANRESQKRYQGINA